MSETSDRPKVEFDRENLSHWPNCATPDCEYKTCTWSPWPTRCFKCGERLLGRERMIEAYNATHGGDGAWERDRA
jgi:hypothetical protein